MSNRTFNVIVHASFALGCVLVVAGCASAGPDRNKSVATSMEDFKKEVAKGIPQIEATSAALTKLASADATGLRPSFDAFSAELAKLETQVSVVKSRADAMKAQGQQYFTAWKENLMNVKNPDIRATNEKREAEANKAFSDISESMQQARDSFKPFFSDLQDIQKSLANDLTVSGVTALSTQIKKTTGEAGPVKDKLNEVVSDVDSLAKAFYTPPPAPTPAPAGGQPTPAASK
jgi:predicted  nucleic acid-binding Zn-ribbon protein